MLALPPAPISAYDDEQARFPSSPHDPNRQVVDEGSLGARRWKHLRSLYAACARSSQGACLETVFDKSPDTTISMHAFLVLMMAHFKWPHRERMDIKLRNVYLAFRGGHRGEVDYREIICSMELLRLYKIVQSSATTVLQRFWEMFVGYGGNVAALSELRTIFSIPALTNLDLKHTEQLFEAAICSTLGWPEDKELPTTVSRAQFLKLLETQGSLICWWTTMAWQRLGEEMRLAVCTAAEEASTHQYHERRREYQEHEADKFWRNLTLRHMYVEWVRFTDVQLKVSGQARRLLERKKKLFFAWWWLHTGQQQMKRRRRALGNAFGTFAIKSRIFARMKLFTYSMKKIRSVDHKAERTVLNIGEGFRHLRDVVSTFHRRRALWHWHDLLAWEDRMKMSKQHYEFTLLARVLYPWADYAREIARQNDEELQAVINQQQLLADMRETDKAMAELEAVEIALTERRKVEEAERRQQERLELRERIREKRRQERQEEDELIREHQRDVRRARVKAELLRLSDVYHKAWTEKSTQILEAAITRTQQWFASPEAQDHLTGEFVKLKRYFYEAPNPDTKEKEAVLNDPMNMVAIQIEAKLFQQSTQLEHEIAKVDKMSKGYVTHNEFQQFLQMIGVQLSSLQLRQAIQSLDKSNDGCITVDSIKRAIDNPFNGVKGSIWKLFVDPAHDSLCYYNFQTGERVLEYQMTDEKLQEILNENYVGESRHRAKTAIAQEMKADWEVIEGTYYATRIQRMVRGRKARLQAQKNRWMIDRNEHVQRRNKRQVAVKYLEWRRVGTLYRRFFARQLRCTWQKVYDPETSSEFYFNFQTRVSQYTMPYLLMRYGDVEHPCMWQSVDQGNDQYGYMHLKAGKVLPRKPDGIPLCQHCQTELATRECLQCRSNFCFYCYRQQHFQHFGEFDHQVHSTADASSRHLACHDWREIKMPRCDMCNSQQLLAAQHCLTCEKKYCRPCFRRLHHTKALQEGHIHQLL